MVEKVRKALATPTKMEFVDTPLSDVAAYLKDLHGIEIQLDGQALGKAGVTADTPISLELKGVPLAAALQLIDDKFKELKLVVRDYGILVTTPEEAETKDYLPVVEFARMSDGGEAAAGK